MSDTFYDYARFDDQKVIEIMSGWDGLGGYHGLLVAKMGMLTMGDSLLDVGCGLAHLYEAINRIRNTPIPKYVGVDIDERVLKEVTARYPQLTFMNKNVYDLSGLEIFDTVASVGLYRYAPAKVDSLMQMLAHTKYCFLTCYYVEPPERGKILDVFRVPGWAHEFVTHDIDDKLEILRMWNLGTMKI